MLLSLFILTNLKRLRCRGVAILDVELIFARFHVGNIYKIWCNILHSFNHSLLAVEDHHLCRILRGQSEADARIVRIERNAGLFKSVGIVDGQLRDVRSERTLPSPSAALPSHRPVLHIQESPYRVPPASC